MTARIRSLYCQSVKDVTVPGRGPHDSRRLLSTSLEVEFSATERGSVILRGIIVEEWQVSEAVAGRLRSYVRKDEVATLQCRSFHEDEESSLEDLLMLNTARALAADAISGRHAETNAWLPVYRRLILNTVNRETLAKYFPTFAKDLPEGQQCSELTKARRRIGYLDNVVAASRDVAYDEPDEAYILCLRGTLKALDEFDEEMGSGKRKAGTTDVASKDPMSPE